MERLTTFDKFVSLNEGGAAIKTSRSIREDELQGTLDSIKSILPEFLGVEDFNEIFFNHFSFS
jgi:hypothetical protein